MYVCETLPVPGPNADLKNVARSPGGPTASAARLVYPRVTQILARWDGREVGVSLQGPVPFTQARGMCDRAFAFCVAGVDREPAREKSEQ